MTRKVILASYALAALQEVSAHLELTETAVRDIVVVIGGAIIALCWRHSATTDSLS